MKPSSVRAMARHLRQVADDLDARCTPTTPHERAALTRTLNSLARYTRHQAQHHARIRTPS